MRPTYVAMCYFTKWEQSLAYLLTSVDKFSGDYHFWSCSGVGTGGAGGASGPPNTFSGGAWPPQWFGWDHSTSHHDLIYCIFWSCVMAKRKVSLYFSKRVVIWRYVAIVLVGSHQLDVLLLSAEPSPLSDICDVLNDQPSIKSPLTEVHKLLLIYLTIPVTTATAKRFSALKRIKT